MVMLILISLISILTSVLMVGAEMTKPTGADPSTAFFVGGLGIMGLITAFICWII